MNNINDAMALVFVSEQTSPTDNVVRSIDVKNTAGSTVVQFETTLHSFDVINRNKRYYLGDNIMDTINNDDEIQTMLRGKRWFGEQDHPSDIYTANKLTPGRMRKIYMPNRSHVILDPKRVGNRLNSVIESSCNDVGQGFRDEVLRGMIPAFSCRALARMENINNRPTVIARKVVTYDWVLYQSHVEAEQIGPASIRNTNLPVMESVVSRNDNDTGIVIPLVDVLAKVSNTDPDVYCIMESFELTEKDLIGYDTKSNRLVISDRDNLIFSRLSKDSMKRMRDLLTSF